MKWLVTSFKGTIRPTSTKTTQSVNKEISQYPMQNWWTKCGTKILRQLHQELSRKCLVLTRRILEATINKIHRSASTLFWTSSTKTSAESRKDRTFLLLILIKIQMSVTLQTKHGKDSWQEMTPSLSICSTGNLSRPSFVVIVIRYPSLMIHFWRLHCLSLASQCKWFSFTFLIISTDQRNLTPKCTLITKAMWL